VSKHFYEGRCEVSSGTTCLPTVGIIMLPHFLMSRNVGNPGERMQSGSVTR
jgi:hypothetical protein